MWLASAFTSFPCMMGLRSGQLTVGRGIISVMQSLTKHFGALIAQPKTKTICVEGRRNLERQFRLVEE